MHLATIYEGVDGGPGLVWYSLIGIRPVLVADPGERFPFARRLLAAVALAWEGPGSHHLAIASGCLQAPAAKTIAPEEDSPLTTLVLDCTFAREGAHWFDVLLDGRLQTRFRLDVWLGRDEGEAPKVLPFPRISR